MPSFARIDVKTFFDRDQVLRAMHREEAKLLSKAGAFVRRRARSSIRKRKKISAPGKPPSSHTGQYKKSILFGYDRARRSVVIGPSASFGGSEVPELLEFGGTAKRRGERVRYLARPTMGPALEAESPNFPKLFKDSIKR